MTTIGWILVIAIFGSILLTGFKILPMYLDYFTVKSVLDGLVQDEEVDSTSKTDLWSAINKRLYINSVRDMKKENFSFKRKDGVTTVTADYEVRKPYIAQLFIGAHFIYSVEINR
jgi:hypothetical protein